MKFFRWVKRLFKKPRRIPRKPVPTDSSGMVIGNKGLKIELHYIKNFTKRERKHYIKCVRITQFIINTEEYKERFLKSYMTRRNRLTRIEIYNLLHSGKDVINTEADGDIDIKITMYRKNNRVIGYRIVGSDKTFLNRKFFNYLKRGIARICGNLIHEFRHTQGFGHPARGYTRKEVPYVDGRLVSKMVLEYLNGAKFTLIS